MDNELVKTFVEDFKNIFGEGNLPDHLEGRLAEEIRFYKIENVQRAIEYFHANPVSDNQKNNPEETFHVCVHRFANNMPLVDIQKVDEQKSPAENTKSQDEKGKNQSQFTKISKLFTSRMKYIPSAAFKVYVFLRSYVNQKILNDSGEMEAWPSHKYICYRTGYSEHTVIEAIRCLKLLGFIKETRSEGKNGNTHYILSDGIEDETQFYTQVHGLKHEGVSVKQIKTEIYRDKNFKVNG